MSVADGILKMEVKEYSRTLDVVKHPKVESARIEVPVEPKEPKIRPPINWNPIVLRQCIQSAFKGKAVIREVGDFVHLFWPNLAHWSCMLWDPKGFPTMLYEMNKYEGSSAEESISASPLNMRISYKLLFSLQSLGLLPKSFSKVKDMKIALKKAPALKTVNQERSGILEYLEDVSKTDEHYFRIYKNCDCIGFENIGVTMASHIPPMLAGYCKMGEKNSRDWNAIETKCIGLGDLYCEFKLVPGEIDGLKDYLEKDSLLVERIHERLMEQLIGFILEGKSLVERPRLGNYV